MIDKVEGPRIANDSNHYVVACFQALSGGWNPPQRISRAQWLDVYTDYCNGGCCYPPHLIGWVGIAASLNGRFFDAYANTITTKEGAVRNYYQEALHSVQDQIPLLSGIKWHSVDYRMLRITQNSIIYCNPPYLGTKRYKDRFDTAAFWRWARAQVTLGHRIFVSEYQASSDWIPVWEQEMKVTLNPNESTIAVERLFVHKSQVPTH